jgi:phosphotransferase system HPr (HPr) family protein
MIMALSLYTTELHHAAMVARLFLEGAVVVTTVEMTNRMGLLGRGSARLTFTAVQFESEILLVSNDFTANAKNVMEVMRLSARAGSQVRIQAIGPDEVAAVKVIAALLTE